MRNPAADEEDALDSFSDIGIGAKWQFLTQDQALLDQALAFSFKIPLADEDSGLGSGTPDYDLTWIGTRSITQQWSASVNMGYTHTTGTDEGEKIPDFVHYGVETQYAISEQWEPVAEVWAETTTDGEHETNVFGDVGIRYKPAEIIQLDAAVGTTLSGDGPDIFATVGFTLYF